MRLIDIPEWSKFFHEKLDTILPESIHDRGYRHAMQDVDAWIEEHTIEAEPVKHGKWHAYENQLVKMIRCSICGSVSSGRLALQTPYCPICGAKMDAMTLEEASRHLGKQAAETLAKLQAEEAEHDTEG